MEKHIAPDLERTLVDDMVGRCNAKIIAAREREEKKAEAVANDEGGTRKRSLGGQRMFRPNSVPTLAAVSETNLCTEPENDIGPSAFSLASQDSTSLPSLATPTPPPKTEKSNLGRLRRSSASLFRSLIELTDIVYFTGIFLDDPSKALLLSLIPPPNRWSIRADHVTVCMGQAGKDLVNPLGGLGSVLRLKVIARGEITGKVVAVKVELAEAPTPILDENEDGESESTSSVSPRLSLNANPHITIAVAVGAKGRDSNDIKTWDPLPNPFFLSGILGERKLVGLKGRGGQPGNTKPKDVSLGGLVMKHHPSLKGREVGKAVGAVEKWMAKTFMDNLAQNAAAIELFITNLKVIGGKVEEE
ncbi:hypothetical protein HDU67_004951, partial [Dinochytrium kinnereticum]